MTPSEQFLANKQQAAFLGAIKAMLERTTNLYMRRNAPENVEYIFALTTTPAPCLNVFQTNSPSKIASINFSGWGTEESSLDYYAGINGAEYSESFLKMAYLHVSGIIMGAHNAVAEAAKAEGLMGLQPNEAGVISHNVTSPERFRKALNGAAKCYGGAVREIDASAMVL